MSAKVTKVGGRTIAYRTTGLGMPVTGDLFSASRVYFAAEFLCAPHHDWEVDWSGSRCVDCRVGDHQPDLHADSGTPGALAGVIVRSLAPQRIWRLTGCYDYRGNGYEAVWPD